MRKKILFIVLDGLGDEPIPDFENKTPLEAADTPHMDKMAEQGQCGLLQVSFKGALPTSEQGHLNLFGYDAEKLGVRRGVFTAQGAGIETREGDIALRGNFGTLNKKGEVVDRRAGRIKTEEAKKLITSLRKIKTEKVRLIIKSATDHRLGIVMRAQGLSPYVSDSDPFYSELSTGLQQVKPLVETEEAQKTAQALNKFLNQAQEVLKNHPVNRQREQREEPPANCVLTRGASFCRKITSFKKKWGLDGACVAGKTLYKQIADSLGMEVLRVKGATGYKDTDLEAKVDRSLDAFKKKDFVFLHIKATDSLAEDGDYEGKKEFIQRVDKYFGRLLNQKSLLAVITSDHSTCSLKKRHCGLDCPTLIWGGERDDVCAFSEKDCREGGLGLFPQIEIMKKILSQLE